MSITFEAIQPALEEELADELGEVPDDVMRKVFTAVITSLGAAAAPPEKVDLSLEDASGEVTLIELKSGTGKKDRVVSTTLDEGTNAAVISGAIVGALTSAMAEWERYNGSYRDVLAALAPKDRGQLTAAALLQARRNARARRDLLQEFGSLTSAEVADAANSKAANRASLANRWREEGKVFAIRVGDQQLYPAFQFDEDGRPVEAVGGALEHLRGELTDWQTALWFTTASGWLGGQRPVDILRDDPEAVAGAAAREVGELVA
jgi:hypothetical protein